MSNVSNAINLGSPQVQDDDLDYGAPVTDWSISRHIDWLSTHLPAILEMHMTINLDIVNQPKPFLARTLQKTIIFNSVRKCHTLSCEVVVTQNICMPFVQCWTNVEYVVSTLWKCFVFAELLLRFGPRHKGGHHLITGGGGGGGV